MSTVAEIESAIEHLSIKQVREIAAWLEDYQATIIASAETFELFDLEEGKDEQWQDPL